MEGEVSRDLWGQEDLKEKEDLWEKWVHRYVQYQFVLLEVIAAFFFVLFWVGRGEGGGVLAMVLQELHGNHKTI